MQLKNYSQISAPTAQNTAEGWFLLDNALPRRPIESAEEAGEYDRFIELGDIIATGCASRCHRKVPVLWRMFQKRLRGYRGLGYVRGEAPLGLGDAVDNLVVEYDEGVLRALKERDNFI